MASDWPLDGKADLRSDVLREPSRLLRCSERCPAARGLADPEARSGSPLRQRGGIGGGDHRAMARRRFALGAAAQSRAAGERCRRMTCDLEVKNGPSMLDENQEAGEDAEVQGRDCEEVDRRDITGIVVQEDAPSLRRRLASAHHVLRHRQLRYLVAEQIEFRANPAPPPSGIVAGYATDEGPDLRVELGAAASAP